MFLQTPKCFFFRAAKGTQEPFLTLHYDEWICILKGKILFEQGDGEENITAIGGQTVFIKEGTRFRSVLPLLLNRRGFFCLGSKRDFSLIEEQLSTKVLSSMGSISGPHFWRILSTCQSACQLSAPPGVSVRTVTTKRGTRFPPT